MRRGEFDSADFIQSMAECYPKVRSGVWMQALPLKRFALSTISAAFLFTTCGVSNASTGAAHRGARLLASGSALETGQRFMLHLHHLHTGETLDVVYRVGDLYVPGAIEKLNYFLRDHRTNDVSHYDPKEFDLLHSVMAHLGRPNGVIDIVCGYRSPWSNELLRGKTANTGVAKKSQHMEAKAIDIRVPGVRTRKLRDIAMSLHGGGVGYYPISQFVHVDVGPVRQWTFSGSDN